MDATINLNVDSDSLAIATEKANRLVELLREAQQIIDSLSDKEELPREPRFYSNESVIDINNIGGKTVNFSGIHTDAKDISKQFNEMAKRYTEDEQNFISTEALKIFVQAENNEIALRALELLERTAHLFG